jgi:nicotinamide mononucleotide (NMN) deamidase PncC
MSHPGASRFVLEAQIPYSPSALRDYLSGDPEPCCSEETAMEMARVAFKRAQLLGSRRALGISCTAALKTLRERRGEDRAYVCLHNEQREWLFKLSFAEGSRLLQETVLSEAMLEIIAATVCGIQSVHLERSRACQLISLHC